MEILENTKDHSVNQWWHYIEINEWEREEDTCDQGLSQARENRRVGVPLQQNFYLVVSFINFLHTQTWSRKWREIWTRARWGKF